jgi:hypothetical protein
LLSVGRHADSCPGMGNFSEQVWGDSNERGHQQRVGGTVPCLRDEKLHRQAIRDPDPTLTQHARSLADRRQTAAMSTRPEAAGMLNGEVLPPGLTRMSGRHLEGLPCK